MSLAAIACLALMGQGPSKSLYQQVVKRPDPANGYEDFVRAADLVSSPEYVAYSNYEAWILAGRPKKVEGIDGVPEGPPARPSSIPENASLLDVRREIARRFSRVLDLIETGLRKSCRDPREDFGADTTFPEMGPFRSIAKFISIYAYAQVSDGNPNRAATALAESLEFGHRIKPETLIHYLVGVAVQAIALSSIQDLTEGLGERGLAALQRQSRSIQDQPEPYIACQAFEGRMTSKIFADAAKNPDQFDAKGLDDGGGVMVELAKLKPEERRRVLAAASEGVLDQYRQFALRFTLPEALWYESTVGPALPMTAPIEQRVIEEFAPVFEQSLQSLARNRTQIRLLELHCAIVRYRWHTGKYPDSLEDVVDKGSCIDPLDGKPFIYERTDLGFRLASRGLKGTGEIQLRYRRQSKGSSPDDPPLWAQAIP